MIIVDTVLAQRAASGKPVRVALVGGGYMARCIALQIVSAVKGMSLVAIVNRTVEKAERAYAGAGVPSVRRVSSVAALQQAIEAGQPAVTDDPSVVCECGMVDAVIESTGHVEFGTRVCYEALRQGKHVIMLGAEVDASVGPILKTYADSAGVVVSYTDGDEPGVGMNLYRFLDSMGYEPVLMGQMKGFLDRYRNPQTQTELANKLGQNPAVLACFADGSKLALEAAIMGNATGFVPQVRGMKGYPCAHVNDMLAQFTPDDFAAGGLIDYSLGAAPHTGAFVICRNDHPEKRKLMAYLKMGNGPLYMFYTPYHLPPWQIPHSVARAVLFNDPTITPRGAPVCDTISYAKRDLKAGETLDGMGGFTCYGLVERYEVCARESFVPIAVSLDCVLTRDVPKDQPIRYGDVRLPAGRLVDRLRAEQAQRFPVAA
ncbi:NAD(P)-dependent oxidoreductase [uncultured Piscinibacter sp.]|uniref:NAD(P)H-dependent oxidoreductase n=1 Tax=uncultured Piscinibacter sp. TaxID=1131835 RepID=UPI002613F5D9|nr:NAD(P)-dependent oxidoreductase [uncultured Piscinibacter sp.]